MKKFGDDLLASTTGTAHLSESREEIGRRLSPIELDRTEPDCNGI